MIVSLLSFDNGSGIDHQKIKETYDAFGIEELGIPMMNYKDIISGFYPKAPEKTRENLEGILFRAIQENETIHGMVKERKL